MPFGPHLGPIVQSHDWRARVGAAAPTHCSPSSVSSKRTCQNAWFNFIRTLNLPSVLLCFHTTNTNFLRINVVNLAVTIHWLYPHTNVWLPHMACSLSVPTLKHGTHRWFGKCKHIWENEPVSEQHRHSDFFWKLNKTNPPVLFHLKKSFVLINSKNSLWVWKLAWQYLSLLRRSCSFEIHPIEETETLEGQLSRHRAVVNKNSTFQNCDKWNPL